MSTRKRQFQARRAVDTGACARALALAGALAVPASGCMAVSAQLPPTDYAALEKVSDRGEREQLYQDNAIVKHDEPQGARYTKGTDAYATKRSWQSLDAVLRSDENSAAALPTRKLRLSRLFTALTIASGIISVAGAAASAREGLDLQRLNGTGGLLLGAGIATVAFGITAGVLYGKSKADYERAVAIYNDSLAMRLGINDAAGNYLPPAGVLVDEEGFVVLDQREGARADDGSDDGAAKEHGAAEPEPEEVPDAPPVLPSDAPPPTTPAPTSPSPTPTPAPTPTVVTPAPPSTQPTPKPEPAPIVPAPTEPPSAVVPAPPPGGGSGAPPLSLSPRG